MCESKHKQNAAGQEIETLEQKLEGVKTTVVSNDQITKAPDGGWGWIVVMASFMQHALIDGMTCTFGIFYDDILATFNEGSARTQVLSSIIVGVSFLLGPFTGVLINRFDCRSVAMVGGAVGFIGTFLSTFSKNLNIMILLYGVVGGIGLGLVYSPSLVIVSYYFDKRRALATGIATCGSGVGCLVFSPVNQVLIDTYRWKGALWIVSAILFNCTLFAVVYRPLKFTNRKNNPGEPITMSSNANTSFYLKKTVDELKQSLKTITVPFFTDSAFLLFMTSSVLVAMGIQIPYNLLPTFALEKGLSDSDGALLISILGMSNTVSMVLSGLVADYPWTDSILTYSVPLLIGGVASVFVSYYSDFITLAIYCIVIGVGIGTSLSLATIIMLEFITLERLSNALGLLTFFMGISFIIGPPTAGLLVDMTESYNAAFYFVGVVFILSGITCLPIRPIINHRSKIRAATVEVVHVTHM